MEQCLNKIQSQVDGTKERIEKLEDFVHHMKENNTNVDKLIQEQVEICVREMKLNMEQSRRNNVDKNMLPRFPSSSSSLVEWETFHIEWP